MISGRNLRFMSWNSNGYITKIKDVKSEIKKQKCHAVFLQETHSNDVPIEEMEGWKSIHTTQTSKHTGVAILIKNKIFDESSCTIERDVDGCYIVIKCTLKGQLFTLVSVYNPQADPRPLMKLSTIFENYAEGILLIGGDFNIALNPYLDRNSKTKNKQHLSLKPVVERFMTSFHLVDVWRRFHPTDRQFSYQQQNVMSRLDYLFVPEESMHYINTCEISNEKCCSDHQPVLFEIWMSKEESKKPELCLDITEENNKMHIFNMINSVTDKWLSYKHKYWPELDLTVNLCTPLLISVREVENAIQSLAVNHKHVERPDCIPLSFYVNYSYALIPYLCSYYHNILEQSMNIPDSFNGAFELSQTHYRFNVDYLILATIMARWLYDHLESHSKDYTDERKKKVVLFTFKEQPIKVRWSVLRGFIAKEMDRKKTDPPLSNKLKIDILNRVLKNSTRGKYKLLRWGCPLTPVLMTLYLKRIANEMMDSVQDKTSKIFISREHVVVRFSVDFDDNLLEKLKENYINVECKLVDEILKTSECE